MDEERLQDRSNQARWGVRSKNTKGAHGILWPCTFLVVKSRGSTLERGLRFRTFLKWGELCTRFAPEEGV